MEALLLLQVADSLLLPVLLRLAVDRGLFHVASALAGSPLAPPAQHGSHSQDDRQVQLRGDELAADDDRQIRPLPASRSELEPALDPAQDKAVLAVPDAIDEDYAGVRTASSSPLTEDLGEIGHVVSDEDAAIPGREPKYFLVVEPLVFRFLIERPDIVAPPPERSTDARPRDVGVEEKTHAGLFEEL